MEKKHGKYQIGIVTADDCTNFGNRLQNLAMHVLLSNLGYNVHTFHRTYSQFGRKTWKTYVILFLGKFAILSKFIFKKTFYFQRVYKFAVFNRQYIKWSKHSFEDIPSKTFSQKYDALVVGSDQVWNFQFSFNKKESLLYHVPKAVKKIAVAASIGNTHLTEWEKKLFHQYLNNFDAVSVREQSAVALLKPYYKGEIIQIKDPTLLVERKYWENMVLNNKKKMKKPYILLFFLGPISKSVSEFCKKLKKYYQLSVVNLNNIKSPYYGIDPLDFLKIISEAEYILTDSFHCSVFSILFQKRFSIYNRETNEMDSSNRTDELLDLFEIHDVKNIYSVDELVKQIPLSGEYIDGVLTIERHKAEAFIKKNLN